MSSNSFQSYSPLPFQFQNKLDDAQKIFDWISYKYTLQRKTEADNKEEKQQKNRELNEKACCKFRENIAQNKSTSTETNQLKTNLKKNQMLKQKNYELRNVRNSNFNVKKS